jgi:hypothetical protein
MRRIDGGKSWRRFNRAGPRSRLDHYVSTKGKIASITLPPL